MPVRLLAACLIAGVLVCQPPPPPGAEVVRRAIVDLEDPLRWRDAAATLVRLGPAAVPALGLLVDAPQRYVEPHARVLAALYVLGQLGGGALRALPAIEHALGDHDAEIARQALWALGEVGPAATAAERQRLCERIGGGFLGDVARARLQLGAGPAPAQVQAGLGADEPAAAVAACRALRLPLLPELAAAAARDGWRDLVHDRLRLALSPAAVPWDEHALRPAAPDLASAWFALGGQHGDAVIGRGLLRHWEPVQRRRGLLLLPQQAPRELDVRAELLPLLGDPEAELRQIAAAMIGGWGPQGLFALPVLRRRERDDSDVGVRSACKNACGDLLAAGRAQSRLLEAVDARLASSSSASPPLPLPATEADTALLVELLCGVEWCDVKVLRLLLPEPPPGSALPAALVTAVLRLCTNLDPELRAHAAGWLVRHRRDGVRERGRDLVGLSRSSDVAAEAVAWILAGPDATAAELQAAFAHECWRVPVRALVEHTARGLLLSGDERAALVARLGQPGTDGDVTIAATLALLADGVEVDLAPLRVLAPDDEPDPDAWVRALVARRAFAELGAMLEQQIQLALEIPAGIVPP